MTKVKKTAKFRTAFKFERDAIELILKIKISIEGLNEQIKNSGLIWKLTTFDTFYF